MPKKDNTLTRVEFQIMSIIWDINHSACARDIIERYDEPKPAYTTVATNLKVLYLSHRSHAKYRYYDATPIRRHHT